MKLLNDMYTIKAWGDDGKKACIEFNADHIIYHAHFPGNPITPGVCIIKIISEITELITNKSLNLHMVKNLKFVSPIFVLLRDFLVLGLASITGVRLRENIGTKNFRK